MNILIVEDDETLASQIAQVFDSKVISNRIRILHSSLDFVREIHLLSAYDIILTDCYNSYMKALLFTHPSEHGINEIELGQLEEKLAISHTPVEQIDIDTRNGSEIAQSYDVLDAPALVLLREDGVAQGFWQTG